MRRADFSPRLLLLTDFSLDCFSAHRNFSFSVMQLTSKDGHMVVDFYPVKFHTGQIHNRLMLKVVTFCGKTQSKSYINKKDFQYEFDSRTHGYGYQVTDESMIPQLFNSAMGMAC